MCCLVTQGPLFGWCGLFGWHHAPKLREPGRCVRPLALVDIVDEIHFAPKKPWNDSIRQVPTDTVVPWFQRGAGSRSSTVLPQN